MYKYKYLWQLTNFVNDKRKYQEEKLRYHRALLYRDGLERACRIVNRQEAYDFENMKMKKAAAEKIVNERLKEERTWFLMVKYGRRWLLYVSTATVYVMSYE
jgi:hypothetical protein